MFNIIDIGSDGRQFLHSRLIANDLMHVLPRILLLL